MSLIHEVPTGLRVRPTVTIRHIPGRAIRLPARAGTLLLVAVLIWGALASLTPISWVTLAGIVLVPASLVAALVELSREAARRWPGAMRSAASCGARRS